MILSIFINVSKQLFKSNLFRYFKITNFFKLISQQTFNSRTWATIIILIATVPLLLFFMKSYRDQSRSAMDLISENFICIWGIFCQQALIGNNIKFTTTKIIKLNI